MKRQGKIIRLATGRRALLRGARATVLLSIVSFWSCAAQAAETTTYVLTDAQGTVLAREDAHGTTIATYDYRPYGRQQTGPIAAGPGYTGHVDDPETELVYMQARYYDPANGRLLSVDPIAPAVENLFNFNRYGYADNNPIKNVDATGMFSEVDEIRRHSWGGWQNQTFWRDEHCGVCLETSGSTQATNLAPVNVSARTTSGSPLGASGHAADAVFSTLFGTAFNAMKRPTHPTRIPDSLAHELFMANATGAAIATSPAVAIVGAGAAPPIADASAVVTGALGGAAVRYGPRAAMLGCLSISCPGEDKPDQFVQDREALEEIYEEAKIVGSEAFKMVIMGDDK